MTTITELELEDDDDIDDDFYDYDEEWEDSVAYKKLLEQLPDGWNIVKVYNYTYTTLIDVREWCVENCLGEYREVRWSSGCSYSTAVMFEQDMDTILFKLRWGSK